MVPTYTIGILVFISIIAFSGCAAKAPSRGDFMQSQGGDLVSLGTKWNEGNQLIAEGQAMIEDGQDYVDEGKDLVEKGEELVAEGHELVAEGERLVAESEKTYDEQKRLSTQPSLGNAAETANP